MENITAFKAQEDLIRSGPVKWTPAQANAVFSRHRYEFNRNEKSAKQHISALARMMKDGAWRSGGVIEFARLPDGKITLVDGHHRMLAQVEAGVDVQWTILIHDVQDDDELRNLFWTFDTTLRKRTLTNVLAGVNAAEQMQLSRSMAVCLASAAVVIDNGMMPPVGSNTRHYTPREKLQLASAWVREAQIYELCVDAAPKAMKRKLRSSQVAAVAFLTLRADDDKAWPFWMGIAQDDGLRRGDPRKSFLDWMRDNHLSGSGMNHAAVAAARAWSAWKTGKEMNFIRIGKQAVKIAGTSAVVRP